jgi:2'-5' RNA ligase
MNNAAEHSMYFAAIVCPSPIEEKVLHFKHWMKNQFGCLVAMRSPAHITLIPPFWLDEIRETELLQTLQSFTSVMDELEIQLEDFSHFGKKVLYVHVKENSALEEVKFQAENYFMQSFGDVIKKDDHVFHPHVTIANRDLKPGDFEKAWQHFSIKAFNQTFRANIISVLKFSQGKWNVIGEKNWMTAAK